MRHLFLDRPRLKGSDVRLLKKQLTAWGLVTTPSDEFDDNTAKQVKFFRSVMCLGESEFVDEVVWKTLLSQSIPKLWESYSHDSHKAMAKVAIGLIGVPYLHGSNDPLSGLDSFGFINAMWSITNGVSPAIHSLEELVRLSHIEPADVDRSSVVGGIALYAGKTGVVNHCMYLLNEALAVGAVGGNRYTRDTKLALKRDAVVKVKPLEYRPGLIGFASGPEFRRVLDAGKTAGNSPVAEDPV